MRFAGTAISNYANTPGMESFLDPMRPRADEQVMMSDNIRRQEATAGTELMGRTASKGISAAGEVEAAEILGDAGAAYAQAQGNASIMSGIGKIGGSLIGAIPTGGGGFTPTMQSPLSNTASTWNSMSNYVSNSPFSLIG